MYESFFQLEARPFIATPIADRYYPAASVEHARETVVRCVERAQGPAVILGPAGTGKSTLCQVLAEQLRSQFRVATLASARLCTRRALLQNILFELKLPYRDREEGELRLSLIDHLEPSEACPNGMLLLVDEAHMLPLRLLEEIRMLTNLVRDGQPRVRLVLAASLILDERLASPRLESFNQRIAARCYLQSMNRDETLGYVCAQISAVGGKPEKVFTDEGLHAIYNATDGIPRLVNQVCDHVLIMAAIGRKSPIDAMGVEEAWADLQQLPSPWAPSDVPSDSGEGDSILEFGELDESTGGELGDDKDAATDTTSAQPPVATQIAARLEEIESGIAAVSDDEVTSEIAATLEDHEQQFRPPSDRSPEIEIVFHHAHDPFSERFDEEEVIVDPLASLETLAGSPEIALAEDRSRPTIPFRSTDVSHEAEPSLAKQSLAGRADSVHTVSEEMKESLVASMYEAADSTDPLPGDDRDLLEIQDEIDHVDQSYAPALAAQQPRRREYRQLFAKLRRR